MSRQQKGSGGQDQQEALDEKGGERPVGGQVGHGPGEGERPEPGGPRRGTTTAAGWALSPVATCGPSRRAAPAYVRPAATMASQATRWRWNE
jgi:hypothetical protein